MQETGSSVLELTNREVLKLNGVHNVDVFDEEKITLQTQQGTLEIQGSRLNIISLDLEAGTLQIDGAIDGVLYQQDKKKKQSLKHKKNTVINRLFS